MGIFVSMLRHNSDKKNVTEIKIQNNVRQYKIGKFSCNVTKYDFWICGILQVFPSISFWYLYRWFSVYSLVMVFVTYRILFSFYIGGCLYIHRPNQFLARILFIFTCFHVHGIGN
jgi:hypothetical protein